MLSWGWTPIATLIRWIASAAGTPIATITVSNDSAGYARLLAWILQHAPGPRVVVSMERTRSYGAGLARALTAAGVMVSSASSPAARPAVVSNAADAVVYERAMSG